MSEESPLCPIWKTPASCHLVPNTFACIYDSPRAGGRYWITHLAMEVLKHRDEAFKARLTSWLFERRNSGEDCPKVYARDFNSISERTTLSMEARALNLLVYMTRQLPNQAELFEYETQVKTADYYNDRRRPLIVRHWEVLAWSESSEPEHVCNLLEYLVDKGCLERVRGGATLLRYRITATGWEALEPPDPPTGKIGFK